MTIILHYLSKSIIIKKSIISGKNLINQIYGYMPKNIIGLILNNKKRDIEDNIYENNNLQFVKVKNKLSKNIIMHTCEHVLGESVLKIFGNSKIARGAKDHNEYFFYDVDIMESINKFKILKIELKMKTILNKGFLVKKYIITQKKAFIIFNKINQYYKYELLKFINKKYVSIYKNNNFIDLCRGPHLSNSKLIKEFKITSISSSSWRTSFNIKSLQRIYGVAFSSRVDLLNYYKIRKEIKKRDHRKIGIQMDLFILSNKFNSYKYEEIYKDKINCLVFSYFNNKKIQINFFLEILNKEIVYKLNNLFKKKKIKIKNFSIEPFLLLHNALLFEVIIKISSSILLKSERKKIDILEKSIGKKYYSSILKIQINSKIRDNIGVGLINWLPRGVIVRNVIENFLKMINEKNGYKIVYSPHIGKIDLWKISGHLDFYKKNMFSSIVIDGSNYILKPMNCPFHILQYKNTVRSYKNLPIRLSEFGTVYRYELKGVLYGIMRTRGFTQDDAHIFCSKKDIKGEINEIIDSTLKILKIFGFSKFKIVLSTKPKKYIGCLKKWRFAENLLKNIVIKKNISFSIDKNGGAFYGPKIDINLKDSLGRYWQCSTLQLDFNNPKKFNLNYINSSGKKEKIIMIHRAILGSMERFIGILIEHYNGFFPEWLAPEQFRIIVISDKSFDYAEKIFNQLKKINIRLTIDLENLSLSYKIKKAQMDKVPIIGIVGKKEMLNNGINIRMKNRQIGFIGIEDINIFLLKKISIPKF
jgi:threonyl-tRNA synthetase